MAIITRTTAKQKSEKSNDVNNKIEGTIHNINSWLITEDAAVLDDDLSGLFTSPSSEEYDGTSSTKGYDAKDDDNDFIAQEAARAKKVAIMAEF